MARGPDGTLSPGVGYQGHEAGSGDVEFVTGLEAIIDRALQSTPPGQRFVYGVHQEISPAASELLARRYRAAGWSAVSFRPGATGAYLLVLTP